MPDKCDQIILLDLSEFYSIDLRRLLDGERIYGETERSVREAVLKIAQYSTAKSVNHTKIYKLVALITLILLLAATFIRGFAALGMINVWPHLYLCILIAACVLAVNTVAVHIRHLREKIEIDPAQPRYIKVIFGHGYRMEKERK